MKTSIRRVAPGLLAAVMAAGCASTEIASNTSDRILPEVAVAIQGKIGSEGVDSVSVRVPLQILVNAKDNAGLSSVVTRVFADTQVVGRDSVGFVASSATFNKTLSIPLAGVRPGQLITVRTVVTDGSGNSTTSQAFAVAFDPNVPRIALVSPQPNVTVAGVYNLQISIADSLGVSKAGYRATAPGFSRADSTLFGIPLPKNDTAVFSFPVPGNLVAGTIITITPFAENRDGLRGLGPQLTVRVVAAGPDLTAPVVYQTVAARLETPDSMDISARDADGLVRIVGFIAKNAAGSIVYRSADTLATPAQQVTRRKAFNAPIALRGQTLFITAYAIDASGKTGYAVPNGASISVNSDSLAKRDQVVYAYGLTYGLPTGSLGGDIAVDTTRTTVYVSNINKNQVEAYTYATTLQRLPAIAVGAMPWGMAIDNSNSLLLVANSGGTNISKVSLDSRRENGRVKTANEYVFDVAYTKQDSAGFKYQVSAPIDYSDRPQYIAQSAGGAIYYSTRPTDAATPGTLRRIDNFLDARAEPRQIWQYGSFKKGRYVVINADHVDFIEGASGAPDLIVICEHTPGDNPNTASCVSSLTVEGAVAALRQAPVSGNVVAVKDLDAESLALPDTNFVAVGGDRRRIAFGEGNTASRPGRVLLVFDPTGTTADGAQYSAPIEVHDLTNNASDRVFGLDINRNSSNIGVHGAETFFADSSLRLQGKYATFNTGAGIAFHPDNVDENTPELLARVAFVASGDKSIQIVDSYSYRLRGRIPIRTNLYGPLRAVPPSPAELAADRNLVVKLFGLTPDGLVVIDVRRADIDNALSAPRVLRP
ncbi:MAG: YncE family protein [Gemmatimonadaceae bacterium]